MNHVLITGGAGFIGSHLVDRFLADGCRVTAIDNFDDFYPRSVKEVNIRPHLSHSNYRLVTCDIRDYDRLNDELKDQYDCIVHLAAKAGVRPSIANPIVYQDVNVRGTQNLLEFARSNGISQFVFGSSSSVYGINPNVPWREDDTVLQPISPYAATKVAGELLGHVYSHLYGIRFLALRFFTVYGPRQRPDLAIHNFALRIKRGDALPVFGDGSSRRDYTYVGDIVDGIVRATGYAGSPYEIINLGNSSPVRLSELIHLLEEVLATKARLEFHPEQPGDVRQTYADCSKSESLLGFRASTPIATGLKCFAEWLS